MLDADFAIQSVAFTVRSLCLQNQDVYARGDLLPQAVGTVPRDFIGPHFSPGRSGFEDPALHRFPKGEHLKIIWRFDSTHTRSWWIESDCRMDSVVRYFIQHARQILQPAHHLRRGRRLRFSGTGNRLDPVVTCPSSKEAPRRWQTSRSEFGSTDCGLRNVDGGLVE